MENFSNALNRLLYQTRGFETRVTNESFLLSIGSTPPPVSAPLARPSSHSRLGSAHMSVIIPWWRPVCGCSKEEDWTAPRLQTLALRSKKVDDVSSAIHHCCHYTACPHVRSSLGYVILLNDRLNPSYLNIRLKKVVLSSSQNKCHSLCVVHLLHTNIWNVASWGMKVEKRSLKFDVKARQWRSGQLISKMCLKDNWV